MIRVTISQKGARLESVGKIVEKAVKEKYPDAVVNISRYEPPESRADRFDEAQGDVSDAKSTVEELRDELQSWFDNLPESFQSGDKGSQLEEAISSLDEFIDACDTAENVSVDFPGMY